MHERQEKTKGIKLESQEAVAEAYYTYMKSIMEKHLHAGLVALRLY